MSLLAASDAVRDRRLYLWLGRLDEVLHMSCMRQHFLHFAVAQQCSEAILFWMHACVYELGHPLSFTASTAGVAYPPECLGDTGQLKFPSDEARSVAAAHARYLWKRFVVELAPQQVSRVACFV